MSEQVRGDSIEFGDEIGPLVKTPTVQQVQAFLLVTMAREGRSGRFTDADAAKREGLPEPILPGTMLLAFLAQLLTDWAGPQGRLLVLDVDFRRLARHGEELKCIGLVTDKRDEDATTVVRLDVFIEDHRGDRPAQGIAEVAIPAHA